MKKYFAIAALLGVFAFASVSFLAQAQQPGSGAAAQRSAIPADDPSDGEAAADMAEEADARPEPQSKEDIFVAAHEYCAETAETTKGKAGGEATEEDVAAAYKKCMKKNKYTDDQLNAYEEDGTIK